MDTMKLTLEIGNNLHDIFVQAIEAAIKMEKPEVVIVAVNAMKELFITATAETYEEDDITDTVDMDISNIED